MRAGKYLHIGFLVVISEKLLEQCEISSGKQLLLLPTRVLGLSSSNVRLFGKFKFVIAIVLGSPFQVKSRDKTKQYAEYKTDFKRQTNLRSQMPIVSLRNFDIDDCIC